MRMHRAQTAPHRRHGGAVIVVVLSLMTTLVFLGLFFFGWSSQEVANAELFADPDDEGVPIIDPYLHLDMAAEQLIVGTRSGFEASALWGGMHSMLANKIGRINSDLTATDTNVATGTGIVIRYRDANGDGRPDVQADGTFADDDDFQLIYPDPSGTPVQKNLTDFVLNYSAIAQPNRNADAFNQSGSDRIPTYRPDVDYTYPDVNSLFLASDEVASDPTGTDPNKYRVLIPSFFRPQLFPQMRDVNGTSPNAFFDLYNTNAYERQVLRPHRNHQYPDDGSGLPLNRRLRFLQTSMSAESGNRARTLLPFPFPADASSARMGVFSDITSENQAGNYSLLDVDLDKDGVKDAIWMDLGLPMITLPGGNQYVPLASFKVIDADGLLNLNVHGNFEGTAKLATPRMPTNTTAPIEPISVSNLGMSRSEVNPLWALTGDVDSLGATERAEALKNVMNRFGISSLPAPLPRLALANMEWFMLLSGWNPSTSQDVTLGRHGEETLVKSGSDVPRPGATNADDDNDNSTNGGFGQGQTNVADLMNLTLRGFVHPLAPSGLGLRGFNSSDATPSYLTADSEGAKREPIAPITNNPATWPGYRNFQQLGDSKLHTGLMNPAIANSLLDEADETIVEPGHSQYGIYDSPFSPSENAGLHISESDQAKQSMSSRAKILASANFQHAPDKTDIRSRFTTDSWDRLEFNGAPSLVRDWEWGSGQFPPTFSTVGTQVQPFREELRTLFRTDFESTGELGANRLSPRHRLNINKILSNDQVSGGSKGAFENGSPRYRDLVPHPQTLNGSIANLQVPMHHGLGAAPVNFSLIGSDAYAQEWWARYDRQRLARDIYCLLWTLGCGTDTDLLASNPYSPAQTREMAQFAVNVVDSLDRDNVITEFAYDPNLSDGWDTNPSNLLRVYGVEQQELTFSEVFLIRTLHQGTDAEITEANEEDAGDKFHSFVELRNAAPWNVMVDDSCWRIRRIPLTGAPSSIFTATFKDTSASGTIPPGGEYLIGCQDGSNIYTGGTENGQPRPSDFRVDINSTPDGTFELIVPNKTETSAPTVNQTRLPQCDLDLMHASHSSRIEEATSPTNSLLNTTNTPSGTTDVMLVLERRLLTGTTLKDQLDENGSAMNPWVEVDRVQGRIRDFNAQVSDLDRNDFRSQERVEPFDSGIAPGFATLYPRDYTGSASSTDGRHTMPFLTKGGTERRNSVSPAKFTLWQPHFDRDFSSVMELLSVPLFGYRESADPTAWDGYVFGGPTKNIAFPATTLSMLGHRAAGVRFLNPQAEGLAELPMPDWLPTLTGDAVHYANRWYRLLEFIDVKSQDQLRSDGETTVQRRTPGKINLNTIRHESVMAGLIDDPYHLDPITNQNALTLDRLEPGSRRWYTEHRMFRDGLDPLMSGASKPFIFIPGSFYARPFRSLNYVEPPIVGNAASSALCLQSTILRQRGSIPPTGFTNDEGHGLYEARSSTDTGTHTVDYHTKNRILAKIANNSTTRSHVFFAWIGIDFFEAHQNSNGNVQIGALSTDLPQYRMFCVIDMSRLEEAYDPVTGTFDFRKFIIHSQLLP